MAIGIVETTGGKVRGIELKGRYANISEFRGIPYAAPPVGALRWKAPQDPAKWDGVRACDAYAKMAFQKTAYREHQTTRVTNLEHYYMPMPEMSEDCLYLNVCTGAQAAGEKRPVLMWYHGGGLTMGHSHEIQDDPSELALRGIVVVNVAQRLGPFGYLSLPQLSAEQGGKSGNYGLMDQLKALDWVTENIEAFGGDPGNIAAGGVSGGTWKAAAVAAAPASRGRVRRIIAQSVFRCFMKYATMEEAEAQGEEFVRNIGLDPARIALDGLDGLRAMPAERILGDALPRDHVIGDMCFDGDLVPCRTVLETYEKLKWNVDIMSSTTFGEADVFAEPGGLHYFAHYKTKGGAGFDAGTKIESAAEFYAHFKALLGGQYERHNFESLVKVSDASAWRTARWLASLGLTLPGKASGERTLMKHRVANMHLGKLHPGANYYSYFFTHILPIAPEYRGTPMDPENLLAFHGSDSWFGFNSLRDGVPPHRPWRGEDYSLAAMLCDYWANFVATGNPNGKNLPEWPAGADNYGWLEASARPAGHRGLEGALDRLVHEFVCSQCGLDD
ncbi:MAG: carboxylesterase family protein [Clostridiales bacterium]|jgi:para-nitrobenzyl esterase|nr:carboxylesterase family protein [Clostridiales bacterium]